MVRTSCHVSKKNQPVFRVAASAMRVATRRRMVMSAS
jgi:hypothetical protein